MPQKRSAFFISDRTGITAEMLGHSLLTQFEMVSFNEVTLPFNKMNEKPLGITANDVPPTFLLCRTRPDNTPAPGGGVRPKATNVVNHMAYTVADFDSARIQAQLKAMGVQNVRGTGPNAIHMDDAFGYDVEICGLANNALTDGA
jgi:hypothetical protein